MNSRRQVFAGREWDAPGSTAHAGLWLDRFALEIEQKGKKGSGNESAGGAKQNPKSLLVRQAASIAEPPQYAAVFRRWQKTLQGMGARGCVAEAMGRIILGMGNESVIETSITLHHTYGVPYLPGSALKGVAASFAHHHLGEEWRRGGESHMALFGTTESAGYVTFFDALVVPKTEKGYGGQALYPDILTVHHQDYYSGGPEAPADWDSPNPVPLLSAIGSYWVALAAPPGCDEWANSGFSILESALQFSGVGAKTSSGYGRMRLHLRPVGDRHNVPSVPSQAATPPALDPEQKQAEEMIARIRLLPISKVAPEIAQYAAQWKALQIAEPHKRKIAQAILDKVREANREKKSADKVWYQELLASVRGS